tara:strand:- start:18421 stop:19848 length:1428 start_codon:yes stop_codon:yes gene_type:complete
MPQKPSDLLPTTRLNRKIWKGSNMAESVRRRLMAIARDFVEEVEFLQSDIVDIVLTGSMASFNWTKQSDLDLHILVDFSTIDRNVDLVKKYVNARKTIWNNKHEIRIFGFEVEVYIQDINEPHHAEGIYSIQSKNWIQKPKKMKIEIDNKAVNAKVGYFTHAVDYAYELNSTNEYNEAHTLAQKLKAKLHKMREIGLAREGTWSTENLAFKLLRNNGVVKKLHDLETNSYDDSYSYPQKDYDGKIIIKILSEMTQKPSADTISLIENMPTGWKIHIDHNITTKSYILRVLDECGVPAVVKNEKNPQIVLNSTPYAGDGTYTITNFESLSQYSTLMYDIAIELTEQAGLMPDIEYLSPTASKIWEYYCFSRPNIDKKAVICESDEQIVYYAPTGVILNLLRENNRLTLTNDVIEPREDEQEEELVEIEPYQRSVQKKHSYFKKTLINKGGNTKKEKSHTRASMKRSKSAPPGAGGV